MVVVVVVGGGELERDWDKVGSVHPSGQRNRLKVRGLWCGVMLVDCYDWVMNQDGGLY